jgi:hypothetical protein
MGPEFLHGEVADGFAHLILLIIQYQNGLQTNKYESKQL